MNIEGDKVILREMREQDKEMLLNLIKDSETEKVTGGYSSPVSYDHQMDWFRSQSDAARSLRCVVANKEKSETSLGILILSNVVERNGMAEIYIKLLKMVRGKGYGADSVNALVRYAFCELQLNCIRANILENNMVSRRMFEKCGFKQKGMYKSKIYKDGCYRNVCSFEITATAIPLALDRD